MNILLINHYAGSPRHGMEFRPFHMASEWVRMGHRVEIVACAQSHVRARNPDLKGRVEQLETLDGITYRWLSAPAYRGNGLGRALNIAVFLLRVWRRIGRWARDFKPDCVIASSTYPMDNLLAQRLARRTGARWIYEVHDLWPLSLIELSGMSPAHPFVRLCGWAERHAYRNANAVVSMLPCVHGHMAQRGLDLGRLTIVPNGVDVRAWEADPVPLESRVSAVVDAARQAGAAVVGYAGSMGRPNALDSLLDAAARLRSHPVRFVLVGDGHERARLQRRIDDEGLTHVHLLPPIPKAQIPAFLKTLDVAYIGWQRQPLYRFGIAPNKLMDYMMAECPVLHAVDAGNDPVAEAGCGLTVPPEDPVAIADGVLSLLARPLQERRAMGQRGRDHVRRHHDYAELAQRFLDAASIRGQFERRPHELPAPPRDRP